MHPDVVKTIQHYNEDLVHSITHCVETTQYIPSFACWLLSCSNEAPFSRTAADKAPSDTNSNYDAKLEPPL